MQARPGMEQYLPSSEVKRMRTSSSKSRPQRLEMSKSAPSTLEDGSSARASEHDEALQLTDDGRLRLDPDASPLLKDLRKLAAPSPDDSMHPSSRYPSSAPPPYTERDWTPPPPLNVVVQIVGSRGDVQPFVALGCELRRLGHRVRIATHAAFRPFVRASGLEFFSIGGDPVELMAYMVRNPGMLPKLESLRNGEIARKRKVIAEMLEGCWMSCISPDPDTGSPFVANAIIANPPSFAHVHCAQALGVPLHMMFTMPWSPTSAFPHPLTSLKSSRVQSDPSLYNYYSYLAVSYLTWQGLADIINSFRTKTLGLEEIPLSEGPLLLETLRVPFTYCWSPALMPKPADWPANIDVSGFYFRKPPDYLPPSDLRDFLLTGKAPIYIGFGSIVVDNPQALFAKALEAAKNAGTRAVISTGWTSIKPEEDLKSQDVFFLTDDVPHEWLFKYVSAVIHHGGAGTTACGLKYGLPTAIVSFFGDQEHWGKMVAAAGAGPDPIPYRPLDTQLLTDAILKCLGKDTSDAAYAISCKIEKEDGVAGAVASFYRSLSAFDLACDLLPQQPATWLYTKSNRTVKLSGRAARLLAERGYLRLDELRLYVPNQIDIEHRRWDPASGVMASLGENTTAMLLNAVGLWKRPYDMYLKDVASADGQTLSSIQALALAGASLSNGPRLFGNMIKGFTVDLPLAAADGFRTAPRMYGEKVQQREPITGIKSGFITAGKNFVDCASRGTEALATLPEKGFASNGAAGLSGGVCKGVLSFAFNAGSAGLVAYPGHGIVKSLHYLLNSKSRQAIARARMDESRCNRSLHPVEKEEEDEIVRVFLAAIGADRRFMLK